MIALAQLMGRLIMPSNRLTAFLIHGAMALLRSIPPLRTYLDGNGIKPPNAFASGWFVRGRSRLRRGGQIGQGLVRAPTGAIGLSDDALGPGLTLVGFGLPVDGVLSEAARAHWRARGGTFLQFCQRGEAVHRGTDAFEDLDNRLVPGSAPYGWCAVVRPDATVVHDGPVSDAERIARESLALLEAG
jgi:3-(3-hydroxy-phenyl)propionate hydroxylase